MEVKHICFDCQNSSNCSLWKQVCNIDEDFIKDAFDYDPGTQSVCSTVSYCKEFQNKTKRPTWDEYFIEIAKVVSSRATCLRRRYGAVVVKNNVIVSTGYNGSPRGTVNCIDSGICEREELNIPPGERYELCVAVHAEQNAIVNGSPERMKGATIYIAGFEADGSPAEGRPCLLCKRMIINAQISEVVYLSKENRIIVFETDSILDDFHNI